MTCNYIIKVTSNSSSTIIQQQLNILFDVGSQSINSNLVDIIQTKYKIKGIELALYISIILSYPITSFMMLHQCSQLKLNQKQPLLSFTTFILSLQPDTIFNLIVISTHTIGLKLKFKLYMIKLIRPTVTTSSP